MKKVIGIVISLMIVFSVEAKADFTNEDVVHLSSHVGASFALQTVFYGVNSRWLGLNAPASEGLALVETLAVGFIYKRREADVTNSQMMTSMSENALGAVGAIGTHIVFHF